MKIERPDLLEEVKFPAGAILIGTVFTGRIVGLSYHSTFLRLDNYLVDLERNQLVTDSVGGNFVVIIGYKAWGHAKVVLA